MKYISKMANLRIVLRPGLPAQPITGTPAQPSLFVQFRDGVAVVSDQELIDKMSNHRGFGRDFIQVEESEVDPYAAQRVPTEPVHVMTEIENGRVVKREGKPVGSPQQEAKMQEMINKQAKEMAMAMIPDLLQALKEDQEKKSEDNPETTDVEEEVKEEVKEKPKQKPKAKAKK